METGGSTLTSERLTYHRITSADLEDYSSWYTNEEAMKYVAGRAQTVQEFQSGFEKKLKENEKYPEIGWYSVKLKENGIFIGVIKFTYTDVRETEAEVGYGMLPPYWGKAYGTEMLASILNLAKKISNIKKLVASVHPDNLPSRNILMSQHFRLYDFTIEDDGMPTEHFRLYLEK